VAARGVEERQDVCGAGIGVSPWTPGAVRVRREREMASDDAALDVFEGRSCGFFDLGDMDNAGRECGDGPR
jgi:hypothetical protein